MQKKKYGFVKSVSILRNMAQQYANLYDFANYREFLSAYQKARYKADPNFSRNKICVLLGLPNTRSYFKDVLAGKDITKTFVERFIAAFELDKQEARYFRVLVQFTQSKDAEEREALFQRLIALNQTPHRFISPGMYEYYKENYHSVIRTALEIYPVKEDYRKLGRRLIPPLSEKKTKESLHLMKRLGLVFRDKAGYWKLKEKNVSAGFCSQNEAIKQYQLGKLEKGKKTLLSNMKDPHQTLTMTFSISGKMLRRIEKKVEQFRREIRSMVHKDELPAGQVYQLNIQYYPETKKENGR